MSQQIPTAFVDQFSSNIFHLSQQKGSRLRAAVRNESQKGESGFYDRIGAAVAQKKVSRHADTPQIDTPHSRRRVTLEDYEYADLIDNEDRIKTLIDPTNPYVQAAVWALGRAMDDEVILNALGNAFSGRSGGTTVALGNSEKRAAFDGTTTTGVNLNVNLLRKAKQYFDAGDVDESIPRFLCHSSSQLFSLLNETEITSSDFNTIKALVQGEVDTYMGFKFIRSERLNASSSDITYNELTGAVGSGSGTITAANSRRCIAWAMDGLLLAIGQDIRARISERDDKSYATQIYANMGIGSTRMEEAKVLELDCSE